jgi:nucleoid DNA-binding protein
MKINSDVHQIGKGQYKADSLVSYRELIERFSKESHIQLKYSRYILKHFIRVIKDLVMEDERSVYLYGLGGFTFYETRPTVIKSNYYKKESSDPSEPKKSLYVYTGSKKTLTFTVSHKLLQKWNDKIKRNWRYTEEPIIFEEYPTEEQIIEAKKKLFAIREQQFKECFGVPKVRHETLTEDEIEELYKSLDDRISAFEKEEEQIGEMDNG